jgi:pimeloyl-[acyl-carrier protein] methyl ester esterase
LSTLKIEHTGQGQPLVAIHGWGMNSDVWQPVKTMLEQHFKVYWVDLPGHGRHRDIPMLELADIATELVEQLPDDAIIMGWSLGGLLAQQIAITYPRKVAQLILIASTPCFVQRHDWQTAMPVDVFDKFAENLQTDWQGTISRFLALQFMGVKGIQPKVKALRATMLQCPPSFQALEQGLDLLKETDLRKHENMFNNVHWIMGALDRLIPIALAETLSSESVSIINGAGHAPFISHADEFVDTLLRVTQ